MLSLKLIGLSLAIVSSFPSQQTRHISVMSNRVEGEPEVIVRVPVRKEASVTERFVGEECSNASSSYMSLYLLNGKDAATCNDGSAAGLVGVSNLIFLYRFCIAIICVVVIDDFEMLVSYYWNLLKFFPFTDVLMEGINYIT